MTDTRTPAEVAAKRYPHLAPENYDDYCAVDREREAFVEGWDAATASLAESPDVVERMARAIQRVPGATWYSSRQAATAALASLTGEER